MNRFRRAWAGWLAGLLCAAPAYARGEHCAAALAVSAPPGLKSALMSELVAGELGERPAPPCRDVRVDLRLAGDDGSDLMVTLHAPNGTISRRVSSIVDAAFWVQSWLEPDLDENPNEQRGGRSTPPAAEPEELANITPAPVLPPAPSAGPRATLGLVGRTSLDADRANWNGIELFGDVEIAAPLWLGAGLGRSWDYVFGASALGASVERVTTHAIVRAGGAWDVAPRAEWSIGLGVGVMSAFVRGAPLSGGGVATDDEGVGVIELAAGLRYRPTRGIGLRVGLELARSIQLEPADPREPDEPLARVEPSWRGGLLIGVGLALGKE